MDVAQLRIDPEVQRRLGEAALADVAALIHREGECVVCHNLLGDRPVALQVHSGRAMTGEPQVQVWPAHAPCRPSAWHEHPDNTMPLPPPAENRVTDMAVPMGAAEPRRYWHLPWRKAETPLGLVPGVLINPSLDIQVGTIVEGRWRSSYLDWDETHHGLVPLTDSGEVPDANTGATWGAEMLPPDTPGAAGLLRLSTSTGQTYLANVTEQLRAMIEDLGRCLVVVTHDVPHKAMQPREVLERITKAERVVIGWAALGKPPVEVDWPDKPVPPQFAALAADPTATQARTPADVAAGLADLRSSVRAVFTDHPSLNFPRVQLPGEPEAQRAPVLLLEPIRSLLLTHVDGSPPRELRLEHVLAGGLDRLVLGGAPSLARGWTVKAVKHRGQTTVTLHPPYGQPAAEGELRAVPGWEQAADRLGVVLVVFGVEVGVRAPKGESYDNSKRLAELIRSSIVGTVAWGVVTWERTA